MDDLKLFAKNEDQIDSLANKVLIFQITSKWSLGYKIWGVDHEKRKSS